MASVGKLGFNLRNNLFKNNLKYKNNYIVKIVNKNNVVIGMGSNQIDFKISMFNFPVGVSSAYKVYKVNKISPKYLELFIDRNIKYFSKLYMIVSARHGKSIDINSLMQDEIFVCGNEKEIVYFFEKLNELKENLKQIIIKINYQKKYYLNNIFI